jgi:hypothetical protein
MMSVAAALVGFHDVSLMAIDALRELSG